MPYVGSSAGGRAVRNVPVAGSLRGLSAAHPASVAKIANTISKREDAVLMSAKSSRPHHNEIRFGRTRLSAKSCVRRQKSSLKHARMCNGSFVVQLVTGITDFI
jgi:hypothetical protein